MEEKELPKFDYHLDESDPEVVVLRRQDGAFVAAFSAQGATREGILEAAEEDYRRLLEVCSGSMVPKEDDERQRRPWVPRSARAFATMPYTQDSGTLWGAAAGAQPDP